MKRVLIISPYFPPSNAADMHRVRMSLPYFKQFGWEPAVVAVDARYSEMVRDDLLMESLPVDYPVYNVKAFNKKITSKFGFGSLAFRAMWQYRKGVARILRKEKFDLVYFSTTQFPVCILGRYWKKKFGVPYVIDMQDPWYSDFYEDKAEKPPKYALIYRLHKLMEARAMEHVDGLISVSKYYIDDLKKRHAALKDLPSAVITFGAFEKDLEIAEKHAGQFPVILDAQFINVVYIGRGGADMRRAIAPVFEALKKGLDEQPQTFGRLKFWFIGTSYAPADLASPTVLPLAEKYGVAKHIVEITARISYYHTLLTLQQADALFVPGSEDPKYTASKIYPYLLTGKPILAIFNEKSSVVELLSECTDNATLVTFSSDGPNATDTLHELFEKWADRNFTAINLKPAFDKYKAEALTGEQVALFERSLEYFSHRKSKVVIK